MTILALIIFVAASMSGANPEETYKLPSPDGKFTLVTEIWSGGPLSNYSCIIRVDSPHGGSEYIGELEGLWHNPAHWRTNNIVCINYPCAAKVDFEKRFIELDKQVLQIDIESGSKALKYHESSK